MHSDNITEVVPVSDSVPMSRLRSLTFLDWSCECGADQYCPWMGSDRVQEEFKTFQTAMT